MGLGPKAFRKKQVAEKEAAKRVNKDEMTKKKVKTEDLPSKKTLKKRMKTRLEPEEGEDGIEEALREIKAEEKKKRKAAKKLGPDGKPKPTNKQRKIADFADRVAARGTETPEQKAQREVFVGGLPVVVNQDQLRAHFSGCGEIDEIRLAMRDSGKKSRKYGFISFKDKAAVDSALKLDGMPFDGKDLKVGRCKGVDAAPNPRRRTPRSEGQKGNPDFEVMFGKLPLKATKNFLRKMFRECGVCDRIAIARQKGENEGQTAGVAFVTYRTQEGYEKALAMNGTEVKGRTIRVIKKGTEGPKPPKKEESKDADMAEGDGDEDDEDEEEEEEDDE